MDARLQIAKELGEFFECAGLVVCRKDDAPVGPAQVTESGICKDFIHNDRAKNGSKQLSEETDLVQLSESCDDDPKLKL